MSTLSSDTRGLLEKAIVQARDAAEGAARAALQALAVDRTAPFTTMDATQRQLRNALRARARQLGDGNEEKGIEPLVDEVAYEQWHRMFFARVLAENGLLMHTTGVAVTLEECAELAAEEGEPDAWMLAARYAGAMLPGIFRRDDPAVRVRFAPEGRMALERILGGLPPTLFAADDVLGWAYQFWQSKQKEAINRSGRKIGAAELPAVTQLFTEDYMVRFLLENSLGAWWAARHPASPLLREFAYLRYREDGTPAAGTFPGWPARAAEVTVMDPCCGSGHFLVAAFEMLRRMRMEEEGLSAAAAGDAVLRDNLHGLEIDPRCTQIAAFAVGLAAWETGGYRSVPLPQIACSGTPVAGQWTEWARLAGDDDRLRDALKRLYDLFQQAPTLGSLINPADQPLQTRMFTADYGEVAPLLARALAHEQGADNVADLFGVAAEGVARAARLLAGMYILIATNVPYLGRGDQEEILRSFCESHYPRAKADLATVFLERCRSFIKPGGSYASVTPQTWLFLGRYRHLREHMLRTQTWNHLSPLGHSAFETIGGEVVNVALCVLTNAPPPSDQSLTGIEAEEAPSPSGKARLLQEKRLVDVLQSSMLTNPDARVVFAIYDQDSRLLSDYAHALGGITTGDSLRFRLFFWELATVGNGWVLQQLASSVTTPYGGRESILFWQDGQGVLASLARGGGATIAGRGAWGKRGVVVQYTGALPVTLYTGELFENVCAVVVPIDETLLPAIWAYCQSAEFNRDVRLIDKKFGVTCNTLAKIPFDFARWNDVAMKDRTLPNPYTNDPTQWLFRGRPNDSTAPLQVAMSRLLGYRWPDQEPDALDRLADADGIVCLPAVAGEAPAAERLRALLAVAYGDAWSPATQEGLLVALGYASKGLDAWLRDGFFEQHCALFHNRPFLWHIWDGRRDGFAALVNYHRLDGAALNRLIYTYLGDWITRQRADAAAEVAGAEGRLVAALALQTKLEAIRDGAPPYDIYVRWKPLAAQPLGWDPDLNDGVRLNIRPFVTAGVLRSRFTVNWNKDRGTNPDGSERLNDLHPTLAEKRAARQAQG